MAAWTDPDSLITDGVDAVRIFLPPAATWTADFPVKHMPGKTFQRRPLNNDTILIDRSIWSKNKNNVLNPDQIGGLPHACLQRRPALSRLPLRTIEDAPTDAQPRLEAAQENNGFLPNLVRLLANAPVALEAYQTVGAINARASLTLAEREAVQLTAAAIHACGFCVAGHTAIAEKKAKLGADVISALRDVTQVPDVRLDAVAHFARVVIATRGAVEDADLAAFRAAGFDDQAALEVVLGVSLATLCNFANNLGQPELNPQLTPYEWKGAAQAVAAE